MPDNVTDNKRTYSTGELTQACGVFVPQGTEWFFAKHTPTTSKVTCTHCGIKDWCAEVSNDRITAQRSAGAK